MNPEETVKPQDNEDTDTSLDDAQLEEVAGGATAYDPTGHPSRNYETQQDGPPPGNDDAFQPSGHPSRTD